MAAPDVAHQAISSDEFGYLQELTNDANQIINEAEAWAVGRRGGTAVDTSDPQYNNNAKYYSEQAEIYESYLEDLTVSAIPLDTGAAPTVTKSQFDDHFNFQFGIPTPRDGVDGLRGPIGPIGPRGANTVWVSDVQPDIAEGYNVWLNPLGARDPIWVTAGQVSYNSIASYNNGTIGSALASVEGAMASINIIAREAEAAASRAEAAAASLEDAFVIIDNKISKPSIIPNDYGFLKVNITNPEVSGDPKVQTYSWSNRLNYATDLTNWPKINNTTLGGRNYTLSELGIAPSQGSPNYYQNTGVGLSTKEFNVDVNNKLALASTSIQKLVMNERIYAPESGIVNLGTILTAEDNTNINHNYLDNAWFTVNQRGITAYNGQTGISVSTGDYICDRWKIYEDEGSQYRYISISSNIISIASAGTTPAQTNVFSIGQIMTEDVAVALASRDVVMSINYRFTEDDDFTTVEKHFLCPNIEGAEAAISEQLDPAYGWGILVQRLSSGLLFEILWAGNKWADNLKDTDIQIKNVKLETGLISSLNLEPMPVYADELIKCQKYLQLYKDNTDNFENPVILGNGVAVSSLELNWQMPLEHQLIGVPSMSSTVDLIVCSNFAATGTGVITSTQFNESTLKNGLRDLYLVSAASNLTANSRYYVILPSRPEISTIDPMITFSAEP